MRSRFPHLLLALLAIFALSPVTACSDDGDDDAIEPIGGEKEGTVRYIVYLDGDEPDLKPYRAARAAGEPTAEIEDVLRKAARKRARKLKRKLKSVGAKVVETWYLTNALTVELPEANVATLKGLDGIKKIVPDVFYGE